MTIEEFVSELASRSTDRRQFERLLAFVLAPTAYRYGRSTWFRNQAELRSLGLEVDECEFALYAA